MEMKRVGKVQYLEPELFATEGMSVQGFTTRHEGFSRPPYNSFNLGTNTFDIPSAVEGNRNLLARTIGTSIDRLVTVRQVHGTDILVLDAANDDLAHFLKLEGDGIITNQPEVMIGVTVADCVPVLLLDPVKKVIAALHAGWKGTAGHIARKGVEAFVALFGSSPAHILAAVGPGIGPCCYEVDRPVFDAFPPEVHADEFLTAAGADRWRLDLAAANVRQLMAAGLRQQAIAVGGGCVSCQRDSFFSYRRDGGETGRQMGFIMLTR